jgi:hypothetical protein
MYTDVYRQYTAVYWAETLCTHALACHAVRRMDHDPPLRNPHEDGLCACVLHGSLYPRGKHCLECTSEELAYAYCWICEDEDMASRHGTDQDQDSDACSETVSFSDASDDSDVSDD